MLNVLKSMFGGPSHAEMKKLVEEKGAVVVDVRTKGEFQAGNAPGSVNIPLTDLIGKVVEIKSWNKPVVLCCLSGGRASKALGVLKSNGVEAYNAGCWQNVI
ncbi:hypothetical protein FUAX_16720 [Fulvitalea axinellae]|uniref:Rhodanese domain-containing protein n=1 Tax=Fulvitalea axinellae TaxID=1182444 RepID=A0AAU9DAB3_9BACT|nr:hypothetical protein FUAX_16720 [Fulvitalea axinellae]